ncbi:hypothetical protein TSUD_282210 [Trifolium subterraneum]|uniref:Reverse transcriptase domain-containing protein n=1 Tax=Trifolium subterraneum TaxID=3900 RepID=A0A2Z6LTN7_TRISU|nr:hypothetical protein TSUD_282210 [Trifolium subterraneum]
MDVVRRNTQIYNFKKLDLSRLKELGSLVTFPEDFRRDHGKLLGLLKVNVEKGSLETLVQFYDPLYHCFTFLDYQLVPTLEEYSYLIGLPIPDKVPFSGLEPTPKPLTIAEALHLETSVVKANLTSKGGLLGLSTNFLYQQAFAFAETSVVKANLTSKGGLLGLSTDFLYQQAFAFAEVATWDVGEIIISCGGYSNVPLLGIYGGISYNSTLARRQFGYPMKTKPNNLALTSEFYRNKEDHSNVREKFVQAWGSIRRLDKKQLRTKSDSVCESYTQWVINRATSCGMPYRMPRLLSSTTPPSSLPLPFDTKEEFQEQLAELTREKDTWKRICQAAELENETLRGELEQKDHLIFLQSQQIVEKNDLLQQKDALLRQDSKRKKRQGDLFSSGLDSLKVARRIRYKPTRVYNTRSRLRNKMSNFEEENHMLREQMTTMQTEIEKLTSMVASLMAIQNQAPAPVPQSSSTFVPPPVSSAPFSTPQFIMPEGYPWGMPVGFPGEESRPVVSEVPHVQSTVPIPQLVNTLPRVTATVSAPLVHTIQQNQMPIFHAESVGGYDRMDDLQIKYDEIQKEMRALRGKDLFGQDAHEICLVLDVVVPHKFKVPNFEKYKGNTCPKAHLIMYARKMYTQTSNDKLLIHYFQASLTGAALRWYMDLDRANVSSFNDLASAFIRQYNYNSYLAPDRDELRALAQKERESFKEYAQRWRELASQIRPPLEEKELCKLFLHTLSPFFYEKMVGIVSRSFTEMVEMGMCLEEGVRQGRLIRENAPTNTAKKYGNSFSKKKESEVGMVAQGGPRSRYPTYQHVSAIVPTSQPQMTQAPPPQYPHPYQQPYLQQPKIRPQTPQQPYNYPNRTQRNPPFDPIPMKYADLLPALLAKNFVQTRPPPLVPAVLPTWYRSDLTCAFHQGAPGHDVERCNALKKVVQELIRNKVLTFKDENPNVRNNPLPNHGSSVHFIQSCQETSTTLSGCLKNPQGCSRVQEDIQRLMDKGELVVTKKSEDVCVIVPEFNVSDHLEMIYNSGEPTVTPLVICLPGPMPYTSLRAVPYRYDAIMLQDGMETPIPPLISVDNIADNSKILRSGRILPGVVQGRTGSSVEKTQIPDSSGTGERVYEDSDEVLKMIKRSEYKIVDQLLQTPSKISILSLLMNSDAHREALMKVLDHAYVDHDVTLGQFGSIVGNVTACNNLSFSDEELPERGRDHNLALHISVSCKFDSMSNVLMDTGLSINKPVEHSDPRPSPNFEFPVYEAVEEEDEEIPDKIRRLLDQEERTIQPHKEVIELINLGSEEEKKEIKIGASLEASVKERVIVLLREYVDIFAWSYQDMPGLDPEIVEHHLPLKPECPPVKQKLRRTHPDMALKIKEEVQKQIDAGFLITSEYPQWLANIVPVPKKDGKVRMCVDYRDLNKASPKDDFPLPHIDVLVDNTAKSKVFSFMDGFAGYNQIKMAVEDREKTVFITPWGTFCYKVMPFGLTNAGATYQRGMTTLFHDMMHKEIEVYVDDMIVKSGTEEEHVEYLSKMFQRLRKYRLCLNPNKCTFGVRSGKLLGFIVSQKGIEVDPDKVRAIREMPDPQTEKQVRGFLGRLNYISRFISHMTATCGPIFKLLRKNQGIVWTEDCQKAFDSIKEYLMEPPILIPPVEGRPLIMYLTVLEESMGCVLGQQDETGRKEHAIYYLSKKFTDCESRYSMLEKTCCALAWAAKRLRHYMINHTTWLISKMDPIKYIFEKATLTGRIACWQMLLSEYDIEYRTQKAIKGSILADHLAHQPVEDYQPIKFDFPDEEIMYLKMKDCDEPDFIAFSLYFCPHTGLYLLMSAHMTLLLSVFTSVRTQDFIAFSLYFCPHTGL